ncbi:MAG: hypothetical protein M1829_003634 [Trizodia sp. TS-e1964]|nr:MAG: hypothetical protein M1829_003634 [Trizodia sp. TS-e1964]
MEETRLENPEGFDLKIVTATVIYTLNSQNKTIGSSTRTVTLNDTQIEALATTVIGYSPDQGSLTAFYPGVMHYSLYMLTCKDTQLTLSYVWPENLSESTVTTGKYKDLCVSTISGKAITLACNLASVFPILWSCTDSYAVGAPIIKTVAQAIEETQVVHAQDQTVLQPAPAKTEPTPGGLFAPASFPASTSSSMPKETDPASTSSAILNDSSPASTSSSISKGTDLASASSSIPIDTAPLAQASALPSSEPQPAPASSSSKSTALPNPDGNVLPPPASILANPDIPLPQLKSTASNVPPLPPVPISTDSAKVKPPSPQQTSISSSVPPPPPTPGSTLTDPTKLDSLPPQQTSISSSLLLPLLTSSEIQIPAVSSITSVKNPDAPLATISGSVGKVSQVVTMSTIIQNLAVLGQAVSSDSAGNVQIAGTTLMPNAPAITISGTPVSLNSATQLVIGSSTQPIFTIISNPIPIKEPGSPLTTAVLGQTLSVDDSGKVQIAGSTLVPNAPAITISNTPVSLNSATQLVVGSSTMLLPTANLDPAVSAASAITKTSVEQLLTITDATYTLNNADPAHVFTSTILGQTVSADASGNVVIGTSTLQPGGSAATISGTPVSLDTATSLHVGASSAAGLAPLIISGLNPVTSSASSPDTGPAPLSPDTSASTFSSTAAAAAVVKVTEPTLPSPGTSASTSSSTSSSTSAAAAAAKATGPAPPSPKNSTSTTTGPAQNTPLLSNSNGAGLVQPFLSRFIGLHACVVLSVALGIFIL